MTEPQKNISPDEAFVYFITGAWLIDLLTHSDAKANIQLISTFALVVLLLVTLAPMFIHWTYLWWTYWLPSLK